MCNKPLFPFNFFFDKLFSEEVPLIEFLLITEFLPQFQLQNFFHKKKFINCVEFLLITEFPPQEEVHQFWPKSFFAFPKNNPYQRSRISGFPPTNGQLETLLIHLLFPRLGLKL